MPVLGPPLHDDVLSRVQNVLKQREITLIEILMKNNLFKLVVLIAWSSYMTS